MEVKWRVGCGNSLGWTPQRVAAATYCIPRESCSNGRPGGTVSVCFICGDGWLLGVDSPKSVPRPRLDALFVLDWTSGGDQSPECTIGLDWTMEDSGESPRCEDPDASECTIARERGGRSGQSDGGKDRC